jgi:hypothetical protein
MIDTTNARFTYSDTAKNIDKDPSFSVLFRDVLSVTIDKVSMPLWDENDELVIKQLSLKDKDVDRGPYDKCCYILEI